MSSLECAGAAEQGVEADAWSTSGLCSLTPLFGGIHSARMRSVRKKAALTLANLGAGLIVVGGLGDLLVTRPPSSWFDLLGSAPTAPASPLVSLFLGLLHALGGALIGSGTACLVLINGPLRAGTRWAAPLIALIAIVSDGTNAVVIWRLGIEYWWAPTIFVVLIVVGLIIGHIPSSAFRGERSATKEPYIDQSRK